VRLRCRRAAARLAEVEAQHKAEVEAVEERAGREAAAAAEAIKVSTGGLVLPSIHPSSRP
jgi:hypothetical protein